jgi:hypothetical protein
MCVDVPYIKPGRSVASSAISGDNENLESEVWVWSGYSPCHINKHLKVLVIEWRQRSLRPINKSNDVIRIQCESGHAFLISRTMVCEGFKITSWMISFFYCYSFVARGISKWSSSKKTIAQPLLVTCYLFLYFFRFLLHAYVVEYLETSLDSSTVT